MQLKLWLWVEPNVAKLLRLSGSNVSLLYCYSWARHPNKVDWNHNTLETTILSVSHVSVCDNHTKVDFLLNLIQWKRQT